MVKNLPANAEDAGSISVLGRSPGGGPGNPLQYSCLENPHRQRSLEWYSPWGHKELDMTEWIAQHNKIKFLDFVKGLFFLQIFFSPFLLPLRLLSHKCWCIGCCSMDLWSSAFFQIMGLCLFFVVVIQMFEHFYNSCFRIFVF